MKWTLTAVLLGTVMNLHAQNTPPAWSKNFGGDYWDRPHVVKMVGNDVIVAGSTGSGTNDFEDITKGQADMFLIRTDINGNILWKKTYGGSRSEFCNYAEVTADGGFILVGSVDSEDGDAINSGFHPHVEDDYIPDIWVVKVNSVGDIQWQRAFGGSKSEEAWHVIQTDDDGDGQKDDGYALVGKTRSDDFDVAHNHGMQDIWVIKLSATGDLQWEKTLGGSENEWGYRLQQTPDGGYLVIGETYSGDGEVIGYHDGAADPILGRYSDAWIVKLNASGTQIEWQKSYGGDFSDVAFDILLTDDDGDGQKDDGIIVTGASESEDGDLLSVPGQGSYDVLLIKFNLSGDIQWHKRIGGTGFDRGYSIVQTLDGGFAVLGSTTSTDGDLAGTPSQGDYDFILLKITADGTKEYIQTFGGTNHDEGMLLVQAPSGCYIMTGSTESTDGNVPGSYGDMDIWVLSWCAPTSTSTLPVTLTDFKAQYEANGKTILRWTTETEQNNDRFEIQRSVDGQNYNTIGTVAGSGTTSNTLTYVYIDQGVDALGAEVVYYRLRQVDIDERSELSQVVIVRPRINTGAKLRVWPNPSDGRFHVQLNNTPAGPVKATLFNTNGKVVMSTTLRNTTNEINLSGKSAGTYFIRLEDNHGLIHVQPVIVK